MTGKSFLNAVANGKEDIVDLLRGLIETVHAPYCVIGGLAVNAYAEPVVSLDLDVVVAAPALEALKRAAEEAGLKVETFEHSMNLTSTKSDLRIQIQKDPRYQPFLGRSSEREILGYSMRVAALEDVLQGKLWAYRDPSRRKSKRQKDLADIFRLVETHPRLGELLPAELRSEID